MAKVYSENYVEAWVSFVLDGDAEPMFCNLGLGFQANQRPTANTANTDLIIGWATSGLLGFVPSAYRVGSASFCLYGEALTPSDDSAPIRIFSTLAGSVGTHSGATTSLPNNCAFLVKKASAVGRGGRMFIPGPQDTEVSNTGALSTGERSDLQTLLNDNFGTGSLADLGNSLATDDPPYLAYMRKTTSTQYAITEVTSLVLDGRIATQRRRMRR